MQSPRHPHLDAALRVLLYLREWRSDNSLSVSAYSDVDWASCPTTRCSTTSYCTFLGSSPISWRTNKQHTVSCSLAEAEYMVVALTFCELQWLSYLLHDLGIPHPRPMTLHCDNQVVIYIAANPLFHEKIKHIEIDCRFFCEKLQYELIQTTCVPSAMQLADVSAIFKLNLQVGRSQSPRFTLRGSIGSFYPMSRNSPGRCIFILI